DHHAVGIGEEELAQPCARHVVLAEFDAKRVEMAARPIVVASEKGDVIEIAGILARSGADAGAFGHQMEDGAFPDIEPIARKAEIGAVADAHAEGTNVEVARAVEVL